MEEQGLTRLQHDHLGHKHRGSELVTEVTVNLPGAVTGEVRPPMVHSQIHHEGMAPRPDDEPQRGVDGSDGDPQLAIRVPSKAVVNMWLLHQYLLRRRRHGIVQKSGLGHPDLVPIQECI